MNRTTRVVALIVMVAFTSGAGGADSPRFRGPAGDGVFAETGLLKEWPAGGPKLVWSRTGLGLGYSSATVVDGTVYITGMDGAKQGHLYAFGQDGSPQWNVVYGPELDKTGPAPGGTRGTPTIDGDRIFLMTGFAKLVVLNKADGKVLKTIDLLERFGAGQAKFGFGECVLVDGQKVICTPGGPDASLVALDRDTGATIWKTEGLSQPAGYCSARLLRHNGKKLIVTMLEKVVVGIDADTGKVLWQYDFPNRFGVLPNPPLYADGMLYVVGGGGTGGTLLELADDAMSVTETWKDRTLDCQMQGTVLVDGCIYGTAQSGKRGLVCLDWETGEVHWNADSVGQASVVAADGTLYVYGQNGTMYLVEPSPAAFRPKGLFTVSQGTAEHWAHPTVAHGRLYIRHGDALMAYDVKSGS